MAFFLPGENGYPQPWNAGVTRLRIAKDRDASVEMTVAKGEHDIRTTFAESIYTNNEKGAP